MDKQSLTEKAFEKAIWKINRWASQADKAAGKIYSKAEAMKLFGCSQNTIIDGNALVNEGINELWTILCSAGGDKFDNTNTNLIVGTGTGAEDPTDTEATFTNGVKKGMEASYPTFGTDQKATWKSSYGSGDANQAWEEFGVLNAAASGDLLNRKTSSQGTKTAGQTWELTLEITLS